MESIKILVVEDDLDIRESIEEFLLSEGYEVQCAANGQQALEILHSLKKQPQLILLDLTMPVMDGFRFRKEQEKIPELANIPVILMTADAQIETKRMKIGAQASIQKPFDIEVLSIILRSQLRSLSKML